MAGLNQDLLVYDEKYFDDVAVPKNDSATSEVFLNTQNGVAGSFNVKVVVKTLITLADTKKLTVKIQHSDEKESDFVDLATVVDKTASGETTFAANEVLAQFVIPPTAKKYTRLVMTTDDADVTGIICAYPHYMPR